MEIHLRHFVAPPPAEDKTGERITATAPHFHRHPQTGKELILRAPLPKMFVDLSAHRKNDLVFLKSSTD